jgi:hypothetical protein
VHSFFFLKAKVDDYSPHGAFMRELDTDYFMEEWGFDSGAMDEWDKANGVAKIIKLEGTLEDQQKPLQGVWTGYTRAAGDPRFPDVVSGFLPLSKGGSR